MITIQKLILIIAVAALVLTILFIYGLKKKPTDWQSTILLYLQNFVGSLFIFSGFVKAIDPKGTAYKMEQYFGEFNSIFAEPLASLFPSLGQFALGFSILMIVLELVLGVNLIFGIMRKWTAWLLLPILIFFTILTGFTYLSAYSASSMAFMLIITSILVFGLGTFLVKNKMVRIVLGLLLVFVPGFLINMLMVNGFKFGFSFTDWNYVQTNMKVTDCGCFGDFLKLEPKISFIKDLVLLPPAIWFIVAHGKMTQVLSKKVGYYVLIGSTVVSLLFCFRNSFWALPLYDFRPFYNGVNLPEAKAQCLENVDVIDRYLTYKKTATGEEMEINSKEIGDHRYLWESGEWENLKDKTRDVLIKQGCTSKVKDFEISNLDGEEMTDELMSIEGYNFMVISYSLKKSSVNGFKKVNAVAEAAEKEGIRTFAVTAFNSEEAVDKFRHDVQAAYPFYVADDILLKTIIRSNPGLMLMHNGTIIKKWHDSDIPSFEKIKSTYFK